MLHSLRLNQSTLANYKTFSTQKPSLSFTSTSEKGIKLMEDIETLEEADALIFVPHPDDETVFFGIIPKLISEGKSVQMVYATSGDQGPDYLSIYKKGDELGQAREQELLKALGKLGVKRPPLMLRFTDGKLKESDSIGKMRKVIPEVISQVKPKEIYSLGFDGIVPHPDHIMLSFQVFDATKTYNDSLKAGIPHVTLHQIVFSEDSKKNLGDTMGKANEYWKIPQISHSINISDYTPLLVAALKEHRTQFVDSEVGGFSRFLRKNPYVEMIEPIV